MQLYLGLHTFLIQEVLIPNFKQLYFALFNAISQAIKHIDEENYDAARTILVAAQKFSEELYIETLTDPSQI